MVSFDLKKLRLPLNLSIVDKLHSRIKATFDPFYGTLGTYDYSSFVVKPKQLNYMRINSSFGRKVISKYNELFSGFEITADEEKYKKVADEYRTYLKKIRLTKYLRRVNSDTITFGTGFLEIVYNDTESNESEPKNYTDFMLWDSIDRVKVIPKIEKDKVTKEIKYFKFGYSDSNKFHPDRILVVDIFEKDRLFETIYHPCLTADIIIRSAMDKAERYSTPFYDVTITNPADGECKKKANDLKKQKGRGDFVHSDRIKVEPKGFSGKTIDMKNDFEAALEAISAGSDIPKSLLIGSGAGTISTSETNLKDWFNTLIPIQEYYEENVILGKLFKIYCDAKNLTYEDLRSHLKVIWGDLYPPDRKHVAEIRKIHADTDKIHYDMGLSIEQIDEDRRNYGLDPLAGEE